MFCENPYECIALRLGRTVYPLLAAESLVKPFENHAVGIAQAAHLTMARSALTWAKDMHGRFTGQRKNKIQQSNHNPFEEAKALVGAAGPEPGA